MSKSDFAVFLSKIGSNSWLIFYANALQQSDADFHARREKMPEILRRIDAGRYQLTLGRRSTVACYKGHE